MLRRRLLPTLLGLLLIALLVALRAADPYPLQVARATAFDFFEQLSPRPKADTPVRVVDIDEASLKAIGQWPWPRNVLATLTQRLGELGAAAIGFDVLFAEPDRLSPSRLALSPLAWAGLAKGPPLADYDQQLANALAATPSVLGFAAADGAAALPISPKAGFAISGTDPTPSLPKMTGAVVPLPVLEAAAHGLGGLSLDAHESAGVVRQVPLVWSSGKQYYPSLALEALRVALGESTIVILGDTAGQGYVQGIRVGQFDIPTTAEGDLTIYYGEPDPALLVSARDILGPDYKEMAPLIQGQIVLVGSSRRGCSTCTPRRSATTSRASPSTRRPSSRS